MDPDEKQAANLTVEMPVGAKLFVDGVLIPGESAARKFHTPELVKGKKYYYEMKAEIMVEGKPVVEQRTVIVQAGDSLIERFGVKKVSSEGSVATK